MFAKFSLFLGLLVVFNTVACSQKLIDISDRDDVQIDIKFVGKPGKIKKYLIENSSKQIENPIPNSYEVFEKKYYKIETDAIGYGETISTFKVPVTQENFTKIRILRLIPEELNPNGFEWQDCTITSNSLESPEDERYSASHNDRLKKFLPDFSQKTVSCELQNTIKPEEFFVVTLQTQPTPTIPFTKITWNLESKESTSQNGVLIYKLTFTNAGTKDIAEFNFRSVFNMDTKLNSFKPGQGNCRVSSYGSSIGSMVCYIGKIPAGKNVIVELEGENSGLGGNPNVLGKKNENWEIFGYFKETPNNPRWDANTIWFKPITKTDLIEIKK